MIYIGLSNDTFIVLIPLYYTIYNYPLNNLINLHLILVSRLMSGSAGGTMGHMSNMGSLGACSVTDSKPMQFPLAQRRKRRVLFTQAQVSMYKLNHTHTFNRFN